MDTDVDRSRLILVDSRRKWENIIMNIKTPFAAAAMAVMLPLAASAATVSGQIDISGNAVTSATGVDFTPDFGNCTISTGDFAVLGCDVVGAPTADMTDIVFASPGQVWSIGDFYFVASSYGGPADPTDFDATGLIKSVGGNFDDTMATMFFTTQGQDLKLSFSTTTVSAIPLPAGLMLMGTALAGFGVMRRKAKKAA